MLKNSFGKNNTMGPPLKGISPFAPKILKSTLFTALTQMLWQYLWEYGVQSIDILLFGDFFLLISLLLDSELVLLWGIRKLITFESANFKLIQSSTHLMIIPKFLLKPSIVIFCFHFQQRSDESEENEDSKVNRKEEYKNGREKEGRENGNVNHHTTEQPSKKRKEDFSESKSEVKKPSSEKKKVCKPFDYHTLLLQN